MSYTIDREQGAKILSASTRTIDRYIRAGKIRSKKMGKKVFLHEDDVKKLQNGGIQEDYIVIPSTTIVEDEASFTRRPIVVDYKDLFEDAQKRINQKDQIIQDLSYRVGQAEAELKNSISMIEYKKATFLLESSKTRVEEEKKDLNDKISNLETTIRKESDLNLMLMVLVVILLVACSVVWFMNV